MVKIKQNPTGYFQLQIISQSGHPLLESVPFDTEEQAKTILNQTVSNPIFERKTNHQGDFVIALKTAQGTNVGVSSTYTSEAGMENGIKNLRRNLTTMD